MSCVCSRSSSSSVQVPRPISWSVSARVEGNDGNEEENDANEGGNAEMTEGGEWKRFSVFYFIFCS